VKKLHIAIIGIALAAGLVGCDTVSPSTPTTAPATVPAEATAYPEPAAPTTPTPYPAP